MLRRRHPYDFRETYATLRQIYGYEAFYVNLGYWDQGLETEEAGRRLTFHVADALGLSAGGRLIDAGAGLGQAAVDLCLRHDLAEVWGVNPNPRQVAFANALARSWGLEARVRHERGDACLALAGAEPGAWEGVLALECIGHFPRPEAFLQDALRALKLGGKLAFCLNVARKPLTLRERWGMKLSYGFVPAPEARWVELLDHAGFADVQVEDLTDKVLQPMSEICLERMERLGASLSGSRLSRWATARVLRGVQRAVACERLGYACLVASKPA